MKGWVPGRQSRFSLALHKPDRCCFFSSDVFVVGLIVVMPKESSQSNWRRVQQSVG
jgi:hypothetical protein